MVLFIKDVGLSGTCYKAQMPIEFTTVIEGVTMQKPTNQPNRERVEIIFVCNGCGKPWTGAKKEDRCWCDPSPSYHEEERLIVESEAKNEPRTI